MPNVSLNLLVLKTHQVEAVRDFYAMLGVAFTEEKHGDGPRHYAGQLGGVVLEVYPLRRGGPVEHTTRLGFTVTNLEQTVASLRATGVAVTSEAKATARGYRAVVRDPDGRAVELCEEAGRD